MLYRLEEQLAYVEVTNASGDTKYGASKPKDWSKAGAPGNLNWLDLLNMMFMQFNVHQLVIHGY